jgi:hypothetical protein
MDRYRKSPMRRRLPKFVIVFFALTVIGSLAVRVVGQPAQPQPAQPLPPRIMQPVQPVPPGVRQQPPGAGALQAIPRIPGVNGLPILTTDYRNPSYDISQSGQVCGGKRWLEGGDTPAHEWTQVTDPKNEYEEVPAGLSGVALFPPQDAKTRGLSSRDVPFTHPFGFDWETFIAPDSAYISLLAPSNGPQAVDEYRDAVQRAQQLGLAVPNGVLNVETDQDLIPPIYRAQEGDRVAVFGRWIVDCGHEDFHTEIHPPLLFVTARTGATQGSPTPGSVTVSTVVARPFLVSQEFGDGALRKHLENEAQKYVEVVGSTQLEAHPRVLAPFKGVHSFSYVVRPPVLKPVPAGPANVARPPYVLTAMFHFTVRTGVAVQVVQNSNDSVKVLIVMNSVSYKPAKLPRKRDWRVTFDQLTQMEPAAASAIKKFKHYEQWTHLGGILGNPKDILTDRYEAPGAVSPHDREQIRAPVNALSGGRHFSIDDNQPFPIYGFLSLQWLPTQPTIRQ